MKTKLKCFQEYMEAYLDEQCFLYPQQPQQILFESMRYSLLNLELLPLYI